MNIKLRRSVFGWVDDRVSLLQVGMTFLCDHSGRVYTKQKCTLKDLVSNQEVTRSNIPEHGFSFITTKSLTGLCGSSSISVKRLPKLRQSLLRVFSVRYHVCKIGG